MSQSLKIAVVPRTFPEVSQTFVLDHVTGLIDRGHKPWVFADRAAGGAPLHAEVEAYSLPRRFTPWPQPPKNRISRALAYTHAALALGPGRAIAAVRAPGNAITGRGGALLLAGAELLGFEPDIVHAHFGNQGERMAWLAQHGLLQAPLVVSLHGFDVNRPLAQRQFPYTQMFERAARVIVTTAFMARQAQALGCPAGKIVQLPVGIHAGMFAFAERHWRPGETLRLLTIARLVPQKGIAGAIRAVARLAAEGVHVEYTVIGNGPEREALEKLAQGAPVQFTGALNREALREHCARAHAFLFTPRKVPEGDEEGQGLVVQEAQACGLPVLATRHGGVPEGLIENETALLAQENSDDALHAKLLELLARHADWPAMGRAGRALVEARYTHLQHLDGLERVYAQVLGR